MEKLKTILLLLEKEHEASVLFLLLSSYDTLDYTDEQNLVLQTIKGFLAHELQN